MTLMNKKEESLEPLFRVNHPRKLECNFDNSIEDIDRGSSRSLALCKIGMSHNSLRCEMTRISVSLVPAFLFLCFATESRTSRRHAAFRTRAKYSPIKLRQVLIIIRFGAVEATATALRQSLRFQSLLTQASEEQTSCCWRIECR